MHTKQETLDVVARLDASVLGAQPQVQREESRAAPEAAVRRARWRAGAAWAYGRATEAEHAQASDRGHALRRAVARRATREPLRERAERLMDRLGAAVGYHGDRLTAERLDAFEAALVAVEQAAAALVSGAAEGTRGAGGRP